MKTFKERADDLRDEVMQSIFYKIDEEGVDSKSFSEKCIPVKGEKLGVEVGGHEIKELLPRYIADTRGMVYDYECLDLDELIELVEFINK